MREVDDAVASHLELVPRRVNEQGSAEMAVAVS